MENKSTFKYHVSSFAIHVFSISAALAIAALTPKSEAPVLMEFTTVDSGQTAPTAPSEQITETKISQGPIIKEEPQFDQDIPEKNLSDSSIKNEEILTTQKVSQEPLAKKLPAKNKAAEALPQKNIKTEPPKEVKQNTPALTEPKITVHKMTPAQSAVLADDDGDDKFVVPALETEEVENMMKEDLHEKTAQKFNEDTIRDDLDKVDEEQSVKVAALKTELDSESNNFLSQQEQDLSELEQEKQNTDKALKNNSEKMRASDAAKIAAARRAEERAATEAAAAFVAQQKAMQEKAAQANSQGGDGSGQGQQLDGSAFGVNGPVRQLEDLRQMPGNRKPQYDSDDRLKGRQGEIAFLAFVSKQGRITDLKLIKATGHRSLDSKTLSAIREWKFYPGQEGWVEIPFKWDLKGGPQEMPATLRRKISQR